jgi:phage gp46-like protein
MTDIRTIFNNFSGDWLMVGPEFDPDDGLQTAVVISLFTDRRAEPDDELPSGDDRRGWWGDTFAEIEGDKIGSRLWLLSREKQLASVLNRAREYSLEALQWLIDDGVASSINIEAEIVRPGMLGLSVEIKRPVKPPVQYRFETFWKGN